ncbi:MAG: TIGR02281 family clan AA aspartic protease [Gammaproteobacteria bacterium]
MKTPRDKAPLFGKYMIIAAWVLLLALLTLFFNDQLEQQRNPNRQLRTVTDGTLPEVQLQRNRFGHYVASGEINGQPVEFMLDTGATDVSIPAKVADRLGLERGQRAVYQTANGPITAWRTTIAEIRLGPIRVGPVPASINPNDASEAILLGMTFLRELDFSQQGNTLTLSYPRPGGN